MLERRRSITAGQPAFGALARSLPVLTSPSIGVIWPGGGLTGFWDWGSGEMGGLVISGGRVVDPASGMDAIGDVAVVDGRIAAVGTGLGGAGRQIDATGLVV